MNAFQVLGSWVRRINRYLFLGGGLILMCVMFITVVDVAGRYFRKPLSGALEICELALTAMVFLTVAGTQAEKGHINVDVGLLKRFPHWVQRILDVIASFLGLFIAGLLIWLAIPYALDSMAHNEFTDMLRIPLYPVKFILLIGAAGLFCQFLLDMVDR